jgi:prolipoprotein diacylglyceryltransferase
MEFLKENQEAFENALPINMGQILSIPFVAIGIYMMFRSKKETTHLPQPQNTL